MIFRMLSSALTRESLIALTLKLLCGFNVEEIARAFLAGSETIANVSARTGTAAYKCGSIRNSSGHNWPSVSTPFLAFSTCFNEAITITRRRSDST